MPMCLLSENMNNAAPVSASISMRPRLTCMAGHATNFATSSTPLTVTALNLPRNLLGHEGEEGQATR
jgi:hypothetical protein